MKKIIAILSIVTLLTGCSSETTTKVKKVEKDEPIVEVEKEEEVTYKIGDTISISDDEGEYNFTITGVSETSDRNQFYDEEEVSRVIIIDYAYENVSLEEELFIFSSYFNAYDSTGNLLSTYPASTKSAGSISAGRKTSGQMAYGLNDDNNYVELEYFANMFNSKKDCLIVLEW